VQPFLRPPGGGEGVANWMVDALARRGSVTVLTWEPPDVDSIDAYYGTNLGRSGVEWREVCPWLRRALGRLGIPHEILKLCLLLRHAKRLRGSYRHCLSAYNDLDLGGGAVQYIHFPCHDYRNLASSSPWAPTTFLGKVWPFYIRFTLWLAAWSAEGVRSNITLTNSWWSAQAYRRVYGGPVHGVLYPPPLGAGPRGGSHQREAFLSIGRVDPVKRWPELIEIVRRVRERGFAVGLTLAGSRCHGPTLDRVLEMQRQHASWLRVELDLPRADLDRLLGEHKYGLHGMRDEHYGMAVAELVLGGCLTLVHDSGGQVEIVPQPEARYSDDDDAVEKICRLLCDEAARQRLAEAQQQTRDGLTRERFLKDFDAFLDSLEEGPIEPLSIAAPDP
jgi:glycosyltransferase involved in cell wall biosynthesis